MSWRRSPSPDDPRFGCPAPRRYPPAQVDRYAPHLQGTDLFERLSFDDKYGGLMFDSAEMRRVFKNKWVIFIGDSVMRGFYKDFIVFLQADELLNRAQLRGKGEQSCANDSNVYQSQKTNATSYREVRQYLTDSYRIEFYFTTRSFNEVMNDLFDEIERQPTGMKPDYMFMNTCLWDMTRYTNESQEETVWIKQYLSNITKTCQRLKDILPTSSMFIWLCTLPLASHIGAGFMNDEVKYKEQDLRLGIVECNYHVAQLVASYGFDVLDLHYYMRPMVAYRERDGVHWNAVACRHVTNLILAFVLDAVGETLPLKTIQYLRAQLAEDECDESSALRLDHFVTFGEWPSWTKNMDQMFNQAGDWSAYESYLKRRPAPSVRTSESSDTRRRPISPSPADSTISVACSLDVEVASSSSRSTECSSRSGASSSTNRSSNSTNRSSRPDHHRSSSMSRVASQSRGSSPSCRYRNQSASRNRRPSSNKARRGGGRGSFMGSRR